MRRIGRANEAAPLRILQDGAASFFCVSLSRHCIISVRLCPSKSSTQTLLLHVCQWHYTYAGQAPLGDERVLLRQYFQISLYLPVQK